jgi:hypothetical protein
MLTPMPLRIQLIRYLKAVQPGRMTFETQETGIFQGLKCSTSADGGHWEAKSPRGDPREEECLTPRNCTRRRYLAWLESRIKSCFRLLLAVAAELP